MPARPDSGPWTGGCRCRSVRYTASGAPGFVANCHCRDCRGQTGAAFATWIGFPAERVRIEGAALRTWQADGGVRRSFCGVCGTPIAFAADRWRGELHLLVGTLDDPSAAAPAADVFTVDALSWVAFDERLARHHRVPGDPPAG